MQPVHIVIIGGADTGRAPITAALLRRLLATRNLDWVVESAGVLGHDDATAQPEARDALTVIGLDLSDHRARSLTDELVARATVLLAVDSGIAHVLHLRYPAALPRITTLGKLAGRQRDIPDPFRMQVGVWLSYAREIEALLEAGMPSLLALVGSHDPQQSAAIEDRSQQPVVSSQTLPIGADADNKPSVARETPPDTTGATTSSFPSPLTSGEPAPATDRHQAIARCERLLALLTEMPELMNWDQVRRQLEAEIRSIGTSLEPVTDLSQPYTAMLLALLSMSTTMPGAAQCAMLRTAIGRLRGIVDAQALATLSAEMARWSNV